MQATESIDVAVIGAGPYGLAAASHLNQRKVGLRAFGSPMAGWTDHMPSGMFLKSTAMDSSIGAPVRGFGIGDFCAQHGITPYDDGGGERPIPIAEFIAYGRWYQENLVPQLERAQVTSIGGRPGAFDVELDTGEQFRARTVVLGAGVAPFPHIPHELRLGGSAEHSAKGLLSHACDHADLSLLAGRRVAVVGAGQSALESAVLLQEAGATVHLVARREQITWAGEPQPGASNFLQRLRKPPAPLGAGWIHLLVTHYAGAFRHLPARARLEAVRRILGPFGAWWLYLRFADDIDVRLGRTVLGGAEQGDGIDLRITGPNGVEHLAVDHVIAATGYRVDVGRLDFVAPALRNAVSTLAGSPKLSSTFESSVPGLFFTGLPAAATFGPVLRFVYGSTFAGQQVAAGVANRVRSTV
jgi:cation diffusion facilitator CzcD-associated flavoprotein CzcO